VQLAARMQNAGSLECVELDEGKVRVLGERLARANVTIARISCGDAREATPASEFADAVLVDAPCSSLGVLGRHPEARWRKRPDDGQRLSVDQSLLLASAAARLRPGGRLVYSVCSTDARECENVVDAFLAGSPQFGRNGLPERYAALATPSGDVVVPPGIDGRDGFYIAQLRRAAA
jgi:16S rRNA (cytosine967-C5)-methyltransferase